MKKAFLLLAVCLLSLLFISPESTHSETQENVFLWQEFKTNPRTFDIAAGPTYAWGAYENNVLRWHKQNHTLETYTFDSEVTAVEIAVGNHVWVGTKTGLHRFDGVNWTLYTTANGLPYNFISSLNKGPQDQLIVGAGGSIALFNGAEWTILPTISLDDPYGCFENNNGPIIDIEKDAQNRYWLSTKYGPVCYYEVANGWRMFFLDNVSVHTKDIEIHPNGDKWMTGPANQAATQIKPNGSWTIYNISNGVLNEEATAVTIDPNGHVWLSFDLAQRVYRFNGTTWTMYNLFNGFYGGAALDIEANAAGEIWTAGTTVNRLTNNTWHVYLAGLPSGYMYDMFTNTNGDLWTSVQWKGIVKFDGATWQQYNPFPGMQPRNADAITSDQAGNIWFGLSHEEFDIVGDGLARFDGDAWQIFTTADGLAENRISDIAVDDANNIWIAHLYSGVTQKSSTGWTTFSTTDGLKSNHAGSIIVFDGSIWVGHGTNYASAAGISRYDGADWTTYDETDGLVGVVKDLAVNQNNELLALTDSSVFQFNGTTWTDLAVPSLGLSFWGFAVDAANQIWITGNGGGVIRFDGVQSISITPTVTGVSALGNRVAANSSGTMLWFNSDQGVVKLTIFDATNHIYLPFIMK